MTLEEYKRWLDEQIATVGPVMERLLNARKVLEMAEQELGETRVHPAFREPLPKPVTQLRKPQSGEGPEIRRRVRAEIPRFIEANGPMTSAELIFAFYGRKAEGKLESDRVYSVIAEMHHTGMLTRDPGGRHMLTPSVSDYRNEDDIGVTDARMMEG